VTTCETTGDSKDETDGETDGVETASVTDGIETETPDSVTTGVDHDGAAV